MQEGEDLELILSLGVVENEIWTKQHIVCKLISLRTESLHCEIEDHSSHSASRMQNTQLFPRFFVNWRWIVSEYFFHDWCIALFSFFKSLLTTDPWVWEKLTSDDHSLRKDLIVDLILITSVGLTCIGLRASIPFGSFSVSKSPWYSLTIWLSTYWLAIIAFLYLSILFRW